MGRNNLNLVSCGMDILTPIAPSLVVYSVQTRDYGICLVQSIIKRLNLLILLLRLIL